MVVGKHRGKPRDCGDHDPPEPIIYITRLISISVIERIPESTLLKLAASMIRLYDGKFLCPRCKAVNNKTAMECKCGYSATMTERLRPSEQIKYDNILNEMCG